jgi:toxin ParE1/3/4
MTFRLLPQAETDISEIATYIAYDSKTAALRWTDEIFRQCERIANMPGLGVLRDDLRPGLRMMPSGNYVILYRTASGLVDIVRVLDGRRKWQTLL